MTLRQRIDLLARTGFFRRLELQKLVFAQFGDLHALDESRVRAPRMIYHICAGNLSVSAINSLMHGLLLGSRNVVKLPGDREDSSVRKQILAFIAHLPAPLKRLVATERTLSPATMRRADAVIAFGTDETMREIAAQISLRQKFIAHGTAASLLWIAQPEKLSPAQARACAIDVLTYDQLGCLSPQAIYFPPGAKVTELGDQLAAALEDEWKKQTAKPARPLGIAARIAEARDVAFGLGHRAWLPPKRHLGWTLIHDSDPTFQPSPLHGVIYLRQVSEAKLAPALANINGKISTIGIAGKISDCAKNIFLDLGTTRFCPAGKMQFPPLTWHNDGRAALADLVTWIDHEEVA